MRRRDVYQAGRRIDDVTWRKNNFAAVGFQDLFFLGRFRRHAIGNVFITFGKVVGLNEGDVFQRIGVRVDDYIVNHFESREIGGPEILGDVRAVVSFCNVAVGGYRRDQDISLALCVEQMAYVSRVDHIEHTVTHYGLLGAGKRANDFAHLLRCFDFVTELGEQRIHHVTSRRPYT